ncbi:MAG TPA: leucyl aminopeptidase [Candidatus Limnocylindria bacterium]|jgi:leucyl aminopeptidase|nr:leucyl aminopeptidase [Candidatus Limnocylindria bacterium]
MQVHVSRDAAASVTTGALVVPVFAGTPVDGVSADVDRVLGGAIADVLATGEIAGKPNETSLLHSKDAPFKRVFVIGLGEREKLKPGALAKYAGTAVRYLGKRGIEQITIALPAGLDATLAASFAAEGAFTALLDTTTYRTEPDRPVKTTAVTILTGDYDAAAVEAGVQRGSIIGEAVNKARLMALTPGNDMTPTILAERAKEVAKDAGLEVDVLDEARMQAKGMGSLLGVSRGSDEPATLSVITYKGDPSSTEVLALVGKGLTFDSGGISLKPPENMHEMKYDMSGGAGVIAAMWAIGKLRPKLNVIGLIPSSENLPGPKAMKPGDILRAMNGKTIEVINTDAEGRLILADALCYAKELGATKIVDCATLTGACVIALGHAASGTMSNDDAYVERFLKIVGDCGERYWRLPLYPDFDTQIKSDIADLKNTGGRPGGAETAGAFLKAFVGDTPWIHLDIAGTAYLDGESSHMAKGPTGTPVRAFVTLAEDFAQHGFSTNGVAKAALV